MYKKDFQYFKSYPVSNYSLQTFKTIGKKSLNAEENDLNVKSFWKGYCLQSSLHGIKYVAQDSLHTFERIIWGFLVVFAIIGTAYVSILLSNRFYSSPLNTVVESTVYPVYEIPYPAVTICNYNRINWQRIDEAVKIFLPSNATEDVIKLFKRFVRHLEALQIGSFDEFAEFRNVSLKALDHLFIHDVALFMAHKCEEMFTEECWWRNRFFNCCEIFVRQFSEHGICFAFNSATNDIGKQRIQKESDWPWRTTSFGAWSGLKLTVRIDKEAKPPKSEFSMGAIIVVHNPEEWPVSRGTFLPSGTTASVSVTPKYSYVKPTTRRMTPEQRECLFPDEAAKLSSSLYGLTYLQNNCMSQCRQKYLILFCNCTVQFFFPMANYTPCKASAYKCLDKYDTIFNYEKPPKLNQYFNNEEEGIVCDCLLECNSIDYKKEISSVVLTDARDAGTIDLDIHFQHGTLVKYRTDVVFGWLDLMVSFGGIAGLFLGSSILSAVELFYYLTIGLVVYLEAKSRKSSTNPRLKDNSIKTKNIKVKTYDIFKVKRIDTLKKINNKF